MKRALSFPGESWSGQYSKLDISSERYKMMTEMPAHRRKMMSAFNALYKKLECSMYLALALMAAMHIVYKKTLKEMTMCMNDLTPLFLRSPVLILASIEVLVGNPDDWLPKPSILGLV